MTDYIYAVINNENLVENIIVADNDDAVVPLKMLIPEANDIIYVTEENGPAYIGGDYINGKFRIPKPYQSWTWNENDSTWQAPVTYPQDEKVYVWDENSISWIELVSNAEQLEELEQI
jgi:hypothetical protein